MISAGEKRIRLREVMLEAGCTPVPGVFDALGAKLAQKVGFKALYLGSFSTAISLLGQPDVGSVTMTEMVGHARNIANCVDIPLIVDAENGFAHAANIWRTVKEMESIGAAAIHIEDHEFGKHTNLAPVLLDESKMCKKIEAAAAAREDSNFMIIGRTDSGWALRSVDEMISRANAYLGAGADAVMLAYDPAFLSKEQRDQIKGPVVITGSHRFTMQQESDIGINISLYWPILVNASFYAMREALQILKDTQDYSQLGKYLVPEEELNEYIEFGDFIDRADKYLS